jgi:hypothetical protein
LYWKYATLISGLQRFQVWKDPSLNKFLAAENEEKEGRRTELKGQYH